VAQRRLLFRRQRRLVQQGQHPAEPRIPRLGQARQDVLGCDARCARQLVAASRQTRIVARRTRPVLRADLVEHQLALADRIFGGKSFQVIGHRDMHAGRREAPIEILPVDRRPHLGVKKIPLRVQAALHQVRAKRAPQGGEPQFVPSCARHGGQQLPQIRFPQPLPRHRHQSGKGHGPIPAGDLLRTLQQIPVQFFDAGGQRHGHIFHHLPQPLVARPLVLLFGPREIVRVQQVQFLQGQLQPQGNAGRQPALGQPFGQQHPPHLGVQLAVVPLAYGHRDVLGFVGVQQRQRSRLHTLTARQGLRLRARNRRGNQPHVVRPQRGKPGEVLATRRRLELVQGVDQDHDPAPLGGSHEQLAKCLFHFLDRGRLRQRIVDPQGPGEFANPPPQHRVDLIRPRTDPSRVGQQQHVVLAV